MLTCQDLEKRDQDIIRRAKAGEHYADIARDFRLSRTRVNWIANNAGIQRDPPARTWTKRDCDIIRRYYGKIRTAEIAKLIGCTKNALIGKAHRLGIAGGDNV